MVDNIKIEKNWQDEDFFEVLATCSNNVITASTEVYVTELAVKQLQNEIDQFLQFKKTDIFWKSGERGNQSTPCVGFKMCMKDSRGHVLIEIFMELNDGGDLDKHICCFYINTELGILQDFNSKLSALMNPVIGTSVSLVEEGLW